MGHADIGVTLDTYTHIGLEDAREELKRVSESQTAVQDMQNERETGSSPNWKWSLVKSKKMEILLRFLLNLDDKIYQLMPLYAGKTVKNIYRRAAGEAA